eukprot:314668_1
MSDISGATLILPKIHNKIQNIIDNKYLNEILDKVRTISGATVTMVKKLTGVGGQVNKIEHNVQEIYDTIVLHRDGRENSRYKSYYNLDIHQIAHKHQIELSEKDVKIDRLSTALDQTRTKNYYLTKKNNRLEKRLETFQDVVGKKHIITNLSMTVSNRQLRDRDLAMEHFYKQMGYGADTKQYIRRRDNMWKHQDIKYKELVLKACYGDIIKLLNKDTIKFELDQQQALMTAVLKICANSSNSSYHTLNRGRIWEKWTDEDEDGNSKIRRRRKHHKNGLLVSYGPANYTISKAQKQFELDHPELGYITTEDKEIFHLEEAVAGITTYLTYWTRSDSLSGNYAYHEDSIKKEYGDQINALDKNSRLLINGKTTRGYCWIDAAPISNLKVDSVSNMILCLPDLFEYGYQFSKYLIMRAFNTI